VILSREVAEIRRRTMGEEHPFFIDSLFNVGFFLTKAERWEEAEPCLREAFDHSVRARGDSSSSTQMIVDSLVPTLWVLDRQDESEAVLRRSLTIRRETFGSAHRATQRAISNLVWMLRQTGRDEEADQLETELIP